MRYLPMYDQSGACFFIYSILLRTGTGIGIAAGTTAAVAIATNMFLDDASTVLVRFCASTSKDIAFAISKTFRLCRQ